MGTRNFGFPKGAKEQYVIVPKNNDDNFIKELEDNVIHALEKAGIEVSLNIENRYDWVTEYDHNVEIIGVSKEGEYMYDDNVLIEYAFLIVPGYYEGIMLDIAFKISIGDLYYDEIPSVPDLVLDISKGYYDSFIDKIPEPVELNESIIKKVDEIREKIEEVYKNFAD